MSVYQGPVGDPGAQWPVNSSASLDIADTGDGTPIQVSSPAPSDISSADPPGGPDAGFSGPDAQAQQPSSSPVGAGRPATAADYGGGFFASLHADLYNLSNPAGTGAADTSVGASATAGAIGSGLANIGADAAKAAADAAAEAAKKAAPKLDLSGLKTVGIVLTVLVGGAIVVYGLREFNVARVGHA